MKIRTINIAVLSLKKHETADQLDFDDYDDDEFNCKTQIYIYIYIDCFVNQLWEISMDNHSFVLGLISLEPIFERPGRSHKKAPWPMRPMAMAHPSRESEHHGVN